MLREQTITNELNKRYKNQYETNLYYMKLLNSIVRLPRMADAFYKATKRNEKPGDNKERENLAIRAMRPYVEKGNESEFYDKLFAHLETTFTK